MNGNIEPYIGMIRVNLLDMLHYRADFLLNMLFGVGSSMVMVFVWTVIFAGSGQSQIGNFTLQGMYAYFFLFSAAAALMNPQIINYIQGDIEEGTITLAMTRPINYVTQLFLTSLSNALISAVIVALPTTIIAMLFAHFYINAFNIALLIASIAIGFAISNIMGFLIGTIAVFTTHVYGYRYIYITLISIAAGGTVPLSLFPQYISSILYALPFQNMGYLPASILLGVSTLPEIMNGLAIGAIWTFALAAFAFFWWKKVRKRITSAGG